MLKLTTIECDRPALQARMWPPVPMFSGMPAELLHFLASDAAERTHMLCSLRGHTDEHGCFIQEALSMIYSYIYGYRDSPSWLKPDLALETSLVTAKLLVEDELTGHWLVRTQEPCVADQRDAVRYLRNFVGCNPGVHHALFEYLQNDVTREAMIEFLRLEVCRNEVVDDEVALLAIGLQGSMKKVVISNLWDECGNGQLERFHTYWLRRLIDGLGDWDALPAYRQTRRPWFSSITSNSFNALLTRPSFKLRAFGHFLVTEAWVDAHFQRILHGLERLDLCTEDIAVYFRAHCKIDPHHTEELLASVEHQVPALSAAEASEVVRGAHLAAAAGAAQYGRLLRYLTVRASDP